MDKQHWARMDDEDDAARASALFQAAENVADATTDRQQAVLESMVMYGGDTAGTMSGGAYLTEKLPEPRWISHNIIAVVVDTLVAEVTMDLPRPMAMSLSGDYEGYEASEIITGWWDYEFERIGVDALLPVFIRDSLAGGLGCLRPYLDGDDRLCVERVSPLDIRIDDAGGRSACPRTLYIQRLIDREHLKELFPEHEDAIDEAEGETLSGIDAALSVSTQTTRDDVLCFEAWHLGENGKHVIACSNAMLFEEEYDRSDFPLVFLTSIPPLGGFWGRIPVERMIPIQIEVNKILRRVQLAQHLVSVPRVYVQAGSMTTAKHRNNIGDVISYTGAPPVFQTPVAMPPEIYAHIERLVQFCFQVGMVSQFAAGGTVPAGVNSGRAMRVFREYHSRNFINLERAVEQAICHLGRELLFLAKSMRGTAYYKDVFGDYAASNFEKITKTTPFIKIKPVSALSKTPAAQLEDIGDLMERGIVDLKEAARMSTIPDLEYLRRRLLVSERLIDKLYSRMLSEGRAAVPEPYMDLNYAMQRGAQVAQEAELRAAPQDRIQLVRDFMVAAKDIMDRAAQEVAAETAALNQAAMGAAGGMPPSMPPGGAPPPQLPGGMMPPEGMPPEGMPPVPPGPPMVTG